jgi:hypothetical protein
MKVEKMDIATRPRSGRVRDKSGITVSFAVLGRLLARAVELLHHVISHTVDC